MKQVWYIAVVRSVTYEDDTTAQEEVVRVGPLTKNQLGPTLKKIMYRSVGAIRIFQSAWEGRNILRDR